MPLLSPAKQRNDDALFWRGLWKTIAASDSSNWLPWAIIGCLALVTVTWTHISGFAVKGIPGVVAGLVVLIAAAVYFRREERFLLCVTVLLQVVLFSSFFALLTYLEVAFAGPLVDDRLADWDTALGFDLLRLLAWTNDHPILGALIDATYNTMLLQTAAVVVLLGFANERVPLKLFVLRMMLAGLVTFVFFTALPAQGTPYHYGLTPTPLQAGYLEHLHALRSGLLREFNFDRVEGLVTFPSFHAIWAMLIAIALFHRKGVRWFFVLLNAVVILSTVTSGGHYLCDVWGGAAICIAVCWITREKGTSPITEDAQAKQ